MGPFHPSYLLRQVGGKDPSPTSLGLYVQREAGIEIHHGKWPTGRKSTQGGNHSNNKLAFSLDQRSRQIVDLPLASKALDAKGKKLINLIRYLVPDKINLRLS